MKNISIYLFIILLSSCNGSTESAIEEKIAEIEDNLEISPKKFVILVQF